MDSERRIESAVGAIATLRGVAAVTIPFEHGEAATRYGSAKARVEQLERAVGMVGHETEAVRLARAKLIRGPRCFL